MATGSLGTSSSSVIYQFGRNTASTATPNLITVCFSVLTRETIKMQGNGSRVLRRKNGLNACMVMQQRRNHESESELVNNSTDSIKISDSMEGDNHVTYVKLSSRVEERLAKKKLERTTYLLAAMLSSLGISSMAIMAVYYRFSWQMEGGEFPQLEMFSTFALSVGAAVGMEYWARWAHRALWHASLWHMHQSKRWTLRAQRRVCNNECSPGHCFPLLRLLQQRPCTGTLLWRRFRNYGFWCGLHVRPRWSCPPSIPSRAHRQCTLSSESSCSPPTSSRRQIPWSAIWVVFRTSGIRRSGRLGGIGKKRSKEELNYLRD